MKALMIGLALAAGSHALAVAAQPAGKAAAAQDWARTVAPTPDGGFRIGNPAAAVKLVEYGSLTCDHCAAFEAQGMPKLLQDHVRTGKVSFEFRNFVRDPADLAAALLARCAGADAFFPLTRRYFASQQQWMGRIQAGRETLNALPPGQRLTRAAALGGLDAMAAEAGVPAARASQCLTDEAGARKLADMRRVASQRDQLQGTPHFLINGKPVAAHDWAALAPLLKAAGG